MRAADRRLRSFRVVGAERSPRRSGCRCRSRERIRERHRADRRALCEGQRDHEQPQHGSAQLRGESERRSDRQRGEDRRSERGWLRRLHGQDRVGVTQRVAQGDRCAEAAGSAGFDPEPPPLVQADDDAGRCPGARLRSVIARAGARGLLPGQRTAVRRVAGAVAGRAQGVSHPPSRHDGRDHGAGERLHVCWRRQASGTSHRSACSPTS
jgi:hypothetical protein